MKGSKLVIVMILLTYSTTAFAEKCTQAVPASTPCEGVLLPTKWAVEGERCRSVDLPSCQADVRAAELSKDVSMAAVASELALERAFSRKVEERLLKCLAPPVEAPATPWYQLSWVQVGAGFLLGAGTVLGSVFATK